MRTSKEAYLVRKQNMKLTKKQYEFYLDISGFICGSNINNKDHYFVFEPMMPIQQIRKNLKIKINKLIDQLVNEIEKHYT